METLRLSLHVSILKEWISKLKEGMQTQIRLWSFFSEITKPPFLSPAPGHSLKETAFLLLKGVAFFSLKWYCIGDLLCFVCLDAIVTGLR